MGAFVRRQLDPARRSFDSRDFEAGLRRKIVGQDEAVQAVVDLYQVFRAGLNSPGRPVGNLLFLGPTGAGKTRVVEATAEVLFGDPRAVIKVDCAEFQHSREIAKLIGSPTRSGGISTPNRPVSCEPFWRTRKRMTFNVSFTVWWKAKSIGSRSSLPASIFEKSRMSLSNTGREAMSSVIRNSLTKRN
jgi:hypothetical protein